MKKLRRILESKVDPLLFAFACAMLILVSVTAHAMVQDIANESDRGAEIFLLARLKH
jgi:hypothetical protein